jgi:PAS domain S-box-containing protein
MNEHSENPPDWEAQRESLDIYRRFFQTSQDCVFITTKDGRWVDLNDAAVELFGYSSKEELMPVRIPDLYAISEDRVAHVRTMVEKGFTREYSVDLRKKDGTVMHTLITSVARYDADGNVTGFQGTIRDITERKRAEQDLRTSEERYRSLVDITDTGYLVLDNRGIVVDVNEVYLRLTGRSSIADLIGHPVAEWTAPYDLERNSREVEKCLQTGFVRGLEIDYIRLDGTVQPIEVNATVFHTGDGAVILTLCRDISDRKQTNVALQQARNKLNLLNAVTFQDIQTAAFSLSAYQELVKNLITDAKAKSYFKKQQMFLKKMVDSLDFAKNYQEMGMHPPRWQNVQQVLLYAISHLDFLHLKQNLQLDNLEIFADPLFEKTLFNIMENVLKHGVHATEVTLRYEERPDGLLLLIEDNGVGISPAEKNMIFDRGYGKGTGLGLFLVREVLSITGMTIRETGISGHGTRFEIIVPKGAYRYKK